MTREFLNQTLRELRSERRQVQTLIAKLQARTGHIDDQALICYCLGTVSNRSELKVIEVHLRWCGPCINRWQKTQASVDAVKAGLIRGAWDLPT